MALNSRHASAPRFLADQGSRYRFAVNHSAHRPSSPTVLNIGWSGAPSAKRATHIEVEAADDGGPVFAPAGRGIPEKSLSKITGKTRSPR